ncbi:PH domain-containing protein [Halocatena pleomorpha]|uniref:PH domain-containing protein n=1 Tax=Halocatena pleomorpha TaxID=1785090 RepID=A0A3P3RC10_9EURY|nr:PH domain-containing protein [Halocatena pleomorpha]RRJ31001.1 PH domain-containing protein [Halocatena pleomorpha]
MQGNSDTPSWVTLTEGEQLVWNGHPSLRSVGGTFVVGLILIAVGIGIGALFEDVIRLLSLVPIGLGLFIAGVTYVNYRSVQYVLTAEEVYKKSGIISRNVVNIRLDRIQNTSYTQSLPERFLGYGHIQIDTAGTGGSDLILEDVPNPEHVNGLITEYLDKVRPQPDEQPQSA